MNTSMTRFAVRTATLLSIAAPAAFGNLIDPSFEVNPLTSASNVLTNFPGFQGQWGPENGTIVGPENGVTPAHALRMLRLDDEGGVTTQGFQVTDITSYAGVVDAGSAFVSLNALFNVDAHVPAATGGVYIQFFSASNYGSQIGVGLAGPLALDASPATWEPAIVNTPIPVGTRWLMSQVYYSNASLIGNDGVIHGGYVDAAELRIIPEPSALALLALGALALLRNRSR